MTTSINYQSLAEQIASRNRLARPFLLIQLRDRQKGVRKTTVRTVRDKLTKSGQEIQFTEPECLLHFYSELGLGTVGHEHCGAFITWNPSVCLRRLCQALEGRCPAPADNRPTAAPAAAESVFCRLPAHRYAAMKNIGMDAFFEIEVIGTAA